MLAVIGANFLLYHRDLKNGIVLHRFHVIFSGRRKNGGLVLIDHYGLTNRYADLRK